MAGLKRRTSLGETGKQESIETLAKVRNQYVLLYLY